MYFHIRVLQKKMYLTECLNYTASRRVWYQIFQKSDKLDRDHDIVLKRLRHLTGVSLYNPPKDASSAKNLNEDFMLKQDKWSWCTVSLQAVEDSISRWIHDNFDRVAMGT